jgi:hypothetical protein
VTTRRALASFAAVAICGLAVLPARAAQVAYTPAASAHDAFIAIEPIARDLGWTFRRTEGGAILDDGTGPQTLRIGSRLVREDGSDVALFENAPQDRNGHIALDISDAATLFHMNVDRTASHVALVAPPANEVAYREVPRPATPAPATAATPRPEGFSTPALVRGNAGTLAVSVEFDGNSRVVQTSLSGNAGFVRGSVSTYGNDALTNPVGVVTLGAVARNLAFGSVGNPLSGSVMSNGSLTGVSAHLASTDATYEMSSGRSFNGNVLAFERTTGSASDALAYVSGTAGFNQAILRHAVEVKEPWGTVDYETLLGQRGVGTGIHARTSGKTFLDATASDASGALPLFPGDLATGAVIGRHLGPVTTLSAGYVRSIDAPASPTVGITTRWNGFNLGANVSEHWTNLTAAYSGGNAYGTFFASSGAQKIFGMNGGLEFHRLLAELDLNGSGGATSGIAQVRTNHPGINVAAGVNLNAGTLQPLLGVVIPVAPALSLEAGVVVGPSGRPALRLAMLAGFRAPKPRVATFPVTVFVPDATQYGPLRVFVDGVPAAKPFADTTSLQVPGGRHSLYVESADHRYGSSTRDVLTSSAPANLNLPLLAQRSITGTIGFGGSSGSIPADASLEGIRVVLEPSGESAYTDANGHYVFARAPYAPESTILLDPSTVPSGFESPSALPIGAGVTDITLDPQRKVERTRFK